VLYQCEHHAVWRRPDGVLVDPTPSEYEESHSIFIPRDDMPFTGWQIPTRRIPIAIDAKVAAFCHVSDEADRLRVSVQRAPMNEHGKIYYDMRRLSASDQASFIACHNQREELFPHVHFNPPQMEQPVTKLRMPIPRLSEDEMREVVRDRLACQVMFSSEVPTNLTSMVFGCGMLGVVLCPPADLVESLLGSTEPPETLEGEPPKPKHPGYPEGAGDPPTKPTLIKLPESVRLDLDFGDLDESDVAEVRAEIKAKNERRIREWEDASHAWHDALDADSRARREIDAAHNAAIEAWEASLDQHAEAVAAREAARQDWIDRYDELFAEWGADVGVLAGDMRKTFARSINGYPIFHAFKIVHRDDWKRIEAAIIREQERSISIEV